MTKKVNAGFEDFAEYNRQQQQRAKMQNEKGDDGKGATFIENNLKRLEKIYTLFHEKLSRFERFNNTQAILIDHQAEISELQAHIFQKVSSNRSPFQKNLAAIFENHCSKTPVK